VQGLVDWFELSVLIQHFLWHSSRVLRERWSESKQANTYLSERCVALASRWDGKTIGSSIASSVCSSATLLTVCS
jgi:hypothetical protein